MNRVKVMMRTAWPTLILWVLLVVFGLWRDADWPDSHDSWIAFVLVCLLIEFFLLKVLLMARGLWLSRVWDPFTGSLIATNFMLAVLFLVQEAFYLWQVFFYEKHFDFAMWASRTLEAVAVLSLMWSVWEMTNLPEQEANGP